MTPNPDSTKFYGSWVHVETLLLGFRTSACKSASDKSGSRIREFTFYRLGQLANRFNSGSGFNECASVWMSRMLENFL